MTPQEERQTRLTLVAQTYANTIAWLFETIQCSGFTIAQVRDEVAKIDRGMVEEPSHDDTVHFCPDCERPNQFGELCTQCAAERGYSQQ